MGTEATLSRHALRWAFAGALMGSPAAACTADTSCATYCEYVVRCGPDQAEELGLQTCHWSPSPSEAEQTCMTSCQSAENALPPGERSQWRRCQTCLKQDIAGRCAADAFVDAFVDACADECSGPGATTVQGRLIDDLGPWLSCASPAPAATRGPPEIPAVGAAGTDSTTPRAAPGQPRPRS
jgi:hypothetical protein